MNVAGLDLSLSSTGVRVPGRLLSVRPGTRGAERLADVRRSLWRVLQPAAIDLAVVEGYAFGANMAGVRGVAELGGVARLLLYDLGIPTAEIPPASLKLFATGSGKADKDAMHAAARVAAPLEHFADTDQVDAWWCWAAGMQLVRRPVVRLPARNLAALHAVIMPQVVARTLAGARA